jgi:hypothetical protein
LFGSSGVKGDKVMVRRTTWIILVIFLGLLAFSFYWQSRNKNKDNQGEGTPSPVVQSLLDIKSDEISTLRIEDKRGGVVELMHVEGNGWILIVPKSEATDSNAVDKIVNQFVSLHEISTIDPAPPGDATGLKNPQYQIDLRIKNGRQMIVNVGVQTATGSGYYVKVDDGFVKVVDKIGLEAVTNLIYQPPVLLSFTGMPTLIVTPQP